ncbi:ribosome biogenesis GTPase YqeH [Camelliibacillus cellulosilyticus]|uniref:Ribosome biogenesis GTPase YqeH n=1 Tax=Camelliibacillus cellulosilyticus TaxID=2174486 RepID=A0ABV9GLL5_9BACL
MSETKTCAGCGALIQTEDENKPGYVPPSAVNRDVVVCRRCFRLTHYNEVPDVEPNDDEFIKLLNKISETDSLIVYLVDIFDFNGSWVDGLARFAGHNAVLMVGNKIDILPKSTNQEKLKRWMRHMAREFGLSPIDIRLISATKGWGMETLAEAIESYRNGKDVYVVGCTNVGKSTFINRLIDLFGGDERYKVTTSAFPGTTLNFIQLPLDDGQAIFDTPGIVNRHQMAHVVTYDELKNILPKKELKPKVYQLNEHQTLFFGGLARVDYIGKGRRSLVCYVSNHLYIHRTKTANADALYHEQIGKLLTPPVNADEKPTLKAHDLAIKEGDTDIVISGLGWITVKGTGATLRVFAPESVHVIKRPAIIG